MNVFNRIMDKQNVSETSLGNPLRDAAAIARRQNYFATLRGGQGFKTPRTARIGSRSTDKV